MLTPAELDQFEELGFVTIDTPLSAEQLDGAERAFDTLCAPTAADTPRHPCFNSTLAIPCAACDDFVDMIANPFFERVAQQVLRADRVDYIEVFPIDRKPTPLPESGEYPHWRDEWASGAHVDVQLTRSDFEATPRRDQLTIWLWLSDVTPESGAMRILPGSHRAFMNHWEQSLKPERRQYLPRVHGLRPDPAGPTDEGLPELGTTRWLDQEPTAAVARRGQVRARHFLYTFSIKTIILPRQARDKHIGKAIKKVPFSCSCWLCRGRSCTQPGTTATPSLARASSSSSWRR